MKRALYETFYKLKRDPFRLSPDAHFTYSHPTYQRAAAYLKYAAYREEGFVMITGRPGTGKTTLITDVISQFDPSEVLTSTLVTNQLEATDLLHIVASYFNIRVASETKSTLLLQIEQFLKYRIEEGKRVILIVDEAQGLHRDAVEELRLLSNLVVNNKPMLQIFLVGQEELRDLVKTRDLEQLRQRITAATHLKPLTEEEVFGYIRHRLVAAGWRGDPIIENSAIKLIHHYSEGIPRKLNLICGRFLLHGCLEEKHELSVRDLEDVLGELKDEFLIFDEGLVPIEEILDLENEPTGFMEFQTQPGEETVKENGVEVAGAESGASAAADYVARPEPEPEPEPELALEPLVEAPVDRRGAQGDRVRNAAVSPQPSIQPEQEPGIGSVSEASSVPPAEGMNPDISSADSPAGVAPAVRSAAHVPAAGGNVGYERMVLEKRPQPDSENAQTRRVWVRVRLMLMGFVLLWVMALFLLQLGVYYMSDLVDKEAAVISGKVSVRVAEMKEYYGSSLARIAQDPDVIDLLKSGDQAALRSKEAALRETFSSAINVQLLPPGINKVDLKSSPPLSYAALAQIRAVEAGKPAPVEVHLLNTPQQHVNIVHRIMDADGTNLIGVVRVSFADELLRDILGDLEETNSYIELQQIGTRDVPGILATHGDPGVREGRAELLLPVKGSSWQMAYWPPAGLLWQLRDVSFWVLAALAMSAAALFAIIIIVLFQRK